MATNKMAAILIKNDQFDFKITNYKLNGSW